MDEDRLRIGDSEREAAAADLGEHYTLGRLTTEEHAERLDRIWAARTRGDLAPVFADLPGRRPAGPGRGVVDRVGRRRPGPPRPRFLLLAIAALIVLTVVTHVPFILAGVAAMVALSVVRRRRAACGPLRLDQWRRPAL